MSPSSSLSPLAASGTLKLGRRSVKRLGYGAMQLAGKGVMGPPRDRDEAIAVLREAVEAGVDHIDTSDAYGPHVTNRLIREALAPYPADLVLVTKLGARRGADGAWIPALSAADIQAGVHANLENLGLDVLEVVNLRAMFSTQGPAEGSLEEPLTALIQLQQAGLVKHIGLSNITPTQLDDARKLCPIVCVQNLYNLAHRHDDLLVDALAKDGIPFVPFFPLGGFNPLQSKTLEEVARSLGATPLQTALAWLLHRSPNLLLIPGTSSRVHLRENLAAASLQLPPDALSALDGIGTRV